jgi:hypothetical protein
MPLSAHGRIIGEDDVDMTISGMQAGGTTRELDQNANLQAARFRIASTRLANNQAS